MNPIKVTGIAVIVAAIVIVYFHSDVIPAEAKSQNHVVTSANGLSSRINTTNGGWITAVTEDENGNKLTVHYGVGQRVVSGVYPIAPGMKFGQN